MRSSRGVYRRLSQATIDERLALGSFDAGHTRKCQLREFGKPRGKILTNQRPHSLDAQRALLLQRFPKRRVELPEAYRKIYASEYFDNREGVGLASRITVWLESWMHRVVARRGASVDDTGLLELGAGTLNHVKYETREATYDVVEPFTELVKRSGRRECVDRHYATVWDVPDSAKYSRIISIAVLEHVLDLPHVIARSSLLLSSDGLFQVGIPSEGGLLWSLSWRLKGVPFRLRTGLDYGVLMKWEHVNKADEIRAIVEMFFDRVLVRRFPTPTRHGSFYTYIEASKPRSEWAKHFLGKAKLR